MLFVQTSSAMALANKPVPVAGLPAAGTNPLSLIFVMLYVATDGPFESLPKVRATALSLQTVVLWLMTTG